MVTLSKHAKKMPPSVSPNIFTHHRLQIATVDENHYKNTNNWRKYFGPILSNYYHPHPTNYQLHLMLVELIFTKLIHRERENRGRDFHNHYIFIHSKWFTKYDIYAFIQASTKILVQQTIRRCSDLVLLAKC